MSKQSRLSQRHQKILENKGLAQKIAHWFTDRTSEPYEELFNVAMAGLTLAVDRFDDSRGWAFSTFAVPYIRGEILHYLRDERRPGGIKYSRSIDEQSSAEESSGENNQQLKLTRPKVSSLHMPRIAGRDDWETFEDGLECSLSSYASERIYQSIDLMNAIDKLPARQRKIVILHYFHGLHQVDICPLVDRNAVSVARLLKQARKRLYFMLK